MASGERENEGIITRADIEDTLIEYYDIMIVGLTGQGKSTTADKILIANPDRRAYDVDNEMLEKDGVMKMEDLSMWILSHTPDELERVTTRLKNLVFYRKLEDPHAQINQTRAADWMNVAASTHMCELLSNESTNLRVLDVPGFFGSDQPNEGHSVDPSLSSSFLETSRNTSRNHLNWAIMRTILRIQSAMRMKFRRILYFLPVRGPIERNNMVLQQELQLMAHYFGRSIFQCMVLVATMPGFLSGMNIPEHHLFPPDRGEQSRRHFQDALQMVLPPEDHGPLPNPPLIFLSLSDTCETVVQKVIAAEVVQPTLLQLQCTFATCSHCSKKIGSVKEERLICVSSNDVSNIIPYEESTCHPVMVPKYSLLEKMFGGIQKFVTSRQVLPDYSEMKCEACGKDSSEPGCQRIGTEYMSEYEGQSIHVDHCTEPLQQVAQKEYRFAQPKMQERKLLPKMKLPGVDVCEKTTLVVTKNPQHFHWKGWGLKIDIDESSLPEGVAECSIEIHISLAGQYAFPENSHLVSAVYWLRCEPSCKFTKPISVEIQHCALSENVVRLSFVRSYCSQKQLPYTFKKIGGLFSVQSSYGFIELKGFSGLGVTQEGSEEREYCASLYYLRRESISHEVHFVITWNTEAHSNVTKNHYKAERALPGPTSPVEFESNEISLDIPITGTIVNDCWKIFPLMPPVVKKKQVDTFKAGKLIPSCQLKVKPLSPPLPQSVQDFTLELKLLGAKRPYNFFMIDFDPHAVTDSYAFPVNSTTMEPVEKPTLQDLLKELQPTVSHMWEDIGINLGIEEGTLHTLNANHHDARHCLRELLRTWLKRVKPPPTWHAIVQAVESVGDKELASCLEKKYIGCASASI